MSKSKSFSGLNCSAPAEEMIRFVLRAQLKAMCKLRSRALDWKDPEGVHAMRVCSRRLRSAMSDFRPYVRVSLPRVKLRMIADALGAVRDQDVALLALENLSARAEGEAAAGIQLIAEEFRHRRKHVRARLKVAIRPAVIDEFRAQYEDGLKDLIVLRAKAARVTDAAPSPLREVGRQLLLKRVEEFRDASHHLFFPYHIQELHDLRILGKRLRYALELFSACWDPNLNDVAKEISLLQTSLGELHDCDVWLHILGGRLKQAAGKSKSDVTISRTRTGAIWLVRHFAAERMGHYRSALGRWEDWTANDFLGRLESVLERDK
jgi:CHAD domain-containing protein